jgi:kinesin family protein C1
MDSVRDLLNPANVMTQNNQALKYEAESVTAKDEAQVFQLLKKAEGNRVVAETMCNERSSRSHSIFQIKVDQSTLNLIDLAGSERLNTTKVEGER